MHRSSWDNNLSAPGHLMFTVVAARGLTVEKPTEFFVRVHGKTFKDKTKPAKKDSNPTWGEIFYAEACPAQLEFSLHSPDGLSDKFWGEVSKSDLLDLPSEVLIEKWLDLSPGTKKTKHTISGQIQVRFIRSCLPTLRSILPSSAEDLHYEQRRVKKFNSGDLILYSGAAPHNIAARLDSGLQYSSAGLLLEIPNKWTKAPEWYVLEATDNADGLMDTFADTRAPGLRLFKLEDRLYHFHGAAIWWVPQAKQLESEQVDILRRWAMTAHDASKERPFPPPDPKNVEHIGWKPIEVPSDRIKLLGEFYERAKVDEPMYYPLHSAPLLGLALASIGIVDASTTDTSKWTMENVMTHPFWNHIKNRLLRVSKECHSWYTAGNTDKNSTLEMAVVHTPASSFGGLATRVPSDKAFSQQAKQISDLHAANVTHSSQDSNLVQAPSAELKKKKKKT